LARASHALGIALGALLALACAPTRAQQPSPSAAELMDDLMWGRSPVGGPFELTDHGGRRRTDREFRGRLLVIYFGYTTCPDICPTDLQSIALAVDRLGAAGDAVQPLFITIDPERDTVAHLADYVPLFHPRLIGLTGTAADIRKVALAYKVFFAKVDAPDRSDYAIDHTGFIYLVGKDGQYLGFLPAGTPPDRLAEAIRAHLGATPAAGQ
jgi:cytochrome oxidase Cu insertion factor (SCO1/SenC/PrrC family)